MTAGLTGSWPDRFRLQVACGLRVNGINIFHREEKQYTGKGKTSCQETNRSATILAGIHVNISLLFPQAWELSYCSKDKAFPGDLAGGPPRPHPAPAPRQASASSASGAGPPISTPDSTVSFPPLPEHCHLGLRHN